MALLASLLLQAARPSAPVLVRHSETNDERARRIQAELSEAGGAAAGAASTRVWYPSGARVTRAVPRAEFALRQAEALPRLSTDKWREIARSHIFVFCVWGQAYERAVIDAAIARHESASASHFERAMELKRNISSAPVPDSALVERYRSAVEMGNAEQHTADELNDILAVEDLRDCFEQFVGAPVLYRHLFPDDKPCIDQSMVEHGRAVGVVVGAFQEEDTGRTHVLMRFSDDRAGAKAVESIACKLTPDCSVQFSWTVDSQRRRNVSIWEVSYCEVGRQPEATLSAIWELEPAAEPLAFTSALFQHPQTASARGGTVVHTTTGFGAREGTFGGAKVRSFTGRDGVVARIEGKADAAALESSELHLPSWLPRSGGDDAALRAALSSASRFARHCAPIAPPLAIGEIVRARHSADARITKARYGALSAELRRLSADKPAAQRELALALARLARHSADEAAAVLGADCAAAARRPPAAAAAAPTPPSASSHFHRKDAPTHPQVLTPERATATTTLFFSHHSAQMSSAAATAPTGATQQSATQASSAAAPPSSAESTGDKAAQRQTAAHASSSDAAAPPADAETAGAQQPPAAGKPPAQAAASPEEGDGSVLAAFTNFAEALSEEPSIRAAIDANPRLVELIKHVSVAAKKTEKASHENAVLKHELKRYEQSDTAMRLSMFSSIFSITNGLAQAVGENEEELARMRSEQADMLTLLSGNQLMPGTILSSATGSKLARFGELLSQPESRRRLAETMAGGARAAHAAAPGTEAASVLPASAPVPVSDYKGRVVSIITQALRENGDLSDSNGRAAHAQSNDSEIERAKQNLEARQRDAAAAALAQSATQKRSAHAAALDGAEPEAQRRKTEVAASAPAPPAAATKPAVRLPAGLSSWLS
jgi:hypothetical protein